MRWKVEKRVLERIGHVFRMRKERFTKVIVLGWWEKLERWEKRTKKKWKMILHWKRILRDRLDRCREVDGIHGGLEEDSVREGG